MPGSPDALRIALAQLNPTVGDIAGNARLAREARSQAARLGADLIVFPQLFLTGYPPEDLVARPAFIRAARDAAEMLAAETADGGPAMLIGTPWPGEALPYNSVALLHEGAVAALRHKADLPGHGMFDEKCLFAPGPMPGPINFRDVRIGVPICQDIWSEEVCECLAETGSEFLIAANASPFTPAKHDTRMGVAVARVAETGLPLAYVNQVGGQDEQVFDGASFVLNRGGALALQMQGWVSAVTLSSWKREVDGWRCEPGERVLLEEGEAALYSACMLGLRDYVRKNGFPGVVLGLSGGIDSALVAAIAVDALGPQQVRCVMMPYRFTGQQSLADAAACANALGAPYEVMPIHAAVDGLEEALASVFAGTPRDTAEENLQARARGTLLMALSNKFGPMVVTTGNKSEAAVGYATLYGDMNGGFNPIKDLYKMQVYALARWRNRERPVGGLGPEGPVIPESIIARAPSAELRENQTDQDSLPPYPVLDDILECLIEREMALTDIIARGHAADTVRRVEGLVMAAEHKRRQAAPGVRLTDRHLGRDRRYPVTNHFREAP